MMKMNSTRCSKLFALLLVATLALSAVAPATAISTKGKDVPSDAKVGDSVTATMTLTDLYSNYEEWTLQGKTELTDVTWTVTTYDQAGNQKAKKSYDGRTFNHSLALDSDASKAVVKVSGTVPEVENFSYDPQQAFTFAKLSQTRKGGNTEEIDTWTANYHTEDSRNARNAIAAAQGAIDDASSGANTKEAQSSLDDAISAYNGENFDLAANLADKAKKSANSASDKAQQSEQQNKLLMYGGIAVLVIIIIGGAGFWYRSQQQNNYRLR